MVNVCALTKVEFFLVNPHTRSRSWRASDVDYLVLLYSDLLRQRAQV